MEELGVPYENIDAQTVDRTSDTYPNPFRSIPAASDSDGVELFESGAILLYIADKYGGLDTPERRAAVAKASYALPSLFVCTLKVLLAFLSRVTPMPVHICLLFLVSCVFSVGRVGQC